MERKMTRRGLAVATAAAGAFAFGPAATAHAQYPGSPAGGPASGPATATAARTPAVREPGPGDLVVSDPDISRRTVRPGETVTVSMRLRNAGPLVARSQAPAPSTVYSQGQTFEGRGFEGADGRYFVAMSLSGPKGDTWPYRWGIGGDLPLGRSRVASYPIRLTEPGRYDVMIGIGYGDRIEWVGRAPGVEVVPEGRALTPTPRVVNTAPPQRLLVNGEQVSSDQRPVLREGHLMVPVRFLMQSLGASVDWDPAQKRVTARRGSYSAVMDVGENYANANGGRVHLYPAPLIVDGRTMVPLRFVTEALGGTTSYDVRTKAVAVNVPAIPGGTDVANRR